jgi:hypothetical protein
MTPDEVRAVTTIVSEAFDTPGGAASVIENYRAAMSGIILARDGGQLVGFHFYQTFQIGCTPVFRFSLAAKAPSYPGAGIHRGMVRHLLVRSMWHVNPLRSVALVGVCNNPRTYRNALSIGGAAFPDVRARSEPFPHRNLYWLTADRLQIAGLDPETGLIENRAASVGLRLKEDTIVPSNDPLFQGFTDLIGGDPNRGVLTMVVVRPINLALRSVLHRLRMIFI